MTFYIIAMWVQITYSRFFLIWREILLLIYNTNLYICVTTLHLHFLLLMSDLMGFCSVGNKSKCD